ncbi:MAG: ABC transporter ATP-binding protein [Candidatus Micrarchaeia archaeon]
MQSNNNVIIAENIGKTYVSKKIQYTALKDVSVTVQKGEFLAILGASGSGKTTLMNILGTLDRQTKGRLRIDGVDTETLNDNELCLIRNKKIGFIFQSYNLVNYLSALDNVLLPLMISNIDTPEKIEEAKQLLSELGLSEKYQKKPLELSGGEQQRVAIARALINSPSIILADEPTGNLDSKTADTVLDILMRMAKKNDITIVMVTHDPEIAKSADREIHMKDGVVYKELRSYNKKAK